MSLSVVAPYAGDFGQLGLPICYSLPNTGYACHAHNAILLFGVVEYEPSLFISAWHLPLSDGPRHRASEADGAVFQFVQMLNESNIAGPTRFSKVYIRINRPQP